MSESQFAESWGSGKYPSGGATPQAEEMYNIVANRPNGQSFFAIAPSAGSPSGDNPTRNFRNVPSGRAALQMRLRRKCFLDNATPDLKI